MPGVEQRLRGRATEAVGGARDEDPRHRRPYLRHQRLRERCPSFARDPVLAQWLEADVVCSGVEVRVDDRGDFFGARGPLEGKMLEKLLVARRVAELLQAS